MNWKVGHAHTMMGWSGSGGCLGTHVLHSNTIQHGLVYNMFRYLINQLVSKDRG